MGTKHGLSLEQRFWKHVDKKGEDECWNWTGGLKGGGYGVLCITSPKTTIGAHRYSYELHKGVIPDGLFVCHICNNPSCVNPKHLEVGDQYHNLGYAASLGRMRPPKPKIGENCHLAGITNSQAKEIKQMLANGIKGNIIAKRFNVSVFVVSNIRTGKSWKHITLDS